MCVYIYIYTYWRSSFLEEAGRLIGGCVGWGNGDVALCGREVACELVVCVQWVALIGAISGDRE